MERTFTELIKTAHEHAKAGGWWDTERNTGELLMLIVSECGEALEAHRKGKFADMENFNAFRPSTVSENDAFLSYIKDTFEDELADIVIRIADWMGHNQWVVRVAYVPSVPENVGQALYGVVESIVGYEYGAGESPTNCDTAIHKVFGIANAHNIDLWKHIELKMAYNKTRGYKHGKAY